MPYIYNDEDNAPMNDDAWAGYHNPTVYSSRDEMEYVESGELERRMEAMEEAKEIRKCMIWEGFMDDMEIPRGSACRECPWMKEGILEQYDHLADDDNILPADVYELAHRMCEVCNQHKDDSEDERWDALDKFFREEDEKNGNS